MITPKGSIIIDLYNLSSFELKSQLENLSTYQNIFLKSETIGAKPYTIVVDSQAGKGDGIKDLLHL